EQADRPSSGWFRFDGEARAGRGNRARGETARDWRWSAGSTRTAQTCNLEPARPGARCPFLGRPGGKRAGPVQASPGWLRHAPGAAAAPQWGDRQRTQPMTLAPTMKDAMLGAIPSLRAFAISLSGNVERADDLVQETLMRAIAHVDSFQPDTN